MHLFYRVSFVLFILLFLLLSFSSDLSLVVGFFLICAFYSIHECRGEIHVMFIKIRHVHFKLLHDALVRV